MIVQIIRLILIQAVVGWRDYQNGYRFGDLLNLCPELHTYIPHMHPHQCVSYASICWGVTEVVVKIAANRTEYLCHPRFQPLGAGTPYKDQQTVHCGFDLNVTLVMELLPDGHYKYYCKLFTDVEHPKCLITALQYGKYRCQYCKYPFYGIGCKYVAQGYDQRYTNPLRLCPGSCLECEGQQCSKCRDGFGKNNSTDDSCSLSCNGFSSCYLNTDGTVTYDTACSEDFCKDGIFCKIFSWLPQCQISQSNQGCDQCNLGYFRALEQMNGQIYKCYELDKNCDQTRQYIKFDIANQNYLHYYTTCTICDPGFYYENLSKGCITPDNLHPNCVFSDQSGTKCIACKAWYALQQDGTCQPVQCDSQCQTCLDTNPSFCTTCDISLNRIIDTGTCKCLQDFGLKEGNCIPCMDGYCQECEQTDFYKCKSCKTGSNRVLVNQECICQSGSYDPKNNDQICLACDQTCLACFGPTSLECTQCPDEIISNRILVNNTCPCKIGFADFEIQDSNCGKCHPKCQTCFQAADYTTNQYCLTCIPGQNRVVSEYFHCDCKDNYGDFNGTSEICIMCDYTCGICNDFGPTHCTFCLERSNRYLTSSGECLCKTSYFDDQTDNIYCLRCHYSCVLCSNSIEKDTCLQCPETRSPSDPLATQFECLCSSSNYFDDGFSLACQQCDWSCQTCYGPSSSNCLTCDSTYRQLFLSSCVCPIGYYDIGQLECSKCHYSCNKCFDNTEQDCIACSLDLHFRQLKGNTCKCIDGYQEELGVAQCKKCSYKCQTCGTDPEQCLSCPLNSLRILDPIQGCYCPDEYFDKENEKTCLKCYFKCKTCYGLNDNNCISCDSIANRELKDDECKCKSHYFEQEVQECTICSAFCYECITSFDNCTSCNSDRYLAGSTCRCITKFDGAAISTFNYNGLVQCEKCHYSCGTCGGIDEGTCITCMDSDHRYQVGNTCICKEGYFDAGLPVCEKCSYKCKGCNRLPESCISCLDNTFRQFISGFNRCQCMQRYYDDGQNEVCQKCHYSCLRCNEIDTKCEMCLYESNRIYNDQNFSCDCDIGYYDNGIEICQKCHYSCLSCNSGDANSCNSCVVMSNSNRVFYNNTCKCLFGYYDDGHSLSCQKCNFQCLSCVELSYQCLSCPQTRKIETNCNCQQGYYEVGLQICSKCNSKCLTCEIFSNNCTQCSTNEFRELNLITKTCDCSIGYIEINEICEQCSSSCKTCTQSTDKCASCNQFQILKNNDCICNDGMYESSVDKQCKLCNTSCLTCVNSNNYCLTCSTDNFRQFKPGNTCDCIVGYYENPINQNCEQCSSSCLTCSLQYDNCITCDISLNLTLVYNKCLCSQSYYFDSLAKSCQQCHFSCLECNNSNECTSCWLATRHLDADQKKCICHDGYFEINQQHCSQCHFSCETCQNTNTYCLTCMNQYNRILINNTCQCTDGYYEAGIELCQQCNNLCKTCQSSASSCLSCYDNEQNRYYSQNKCLCKIGYFEQNIQICSKCSNECLTCQGSPDYCTSCDTNAKRIDQSIIHKCPCITGFYQDQDKICQKCHIKCYTCVNQNDQCLSCKYQVNSNRKSLSEQCNCKDGYFDDGTQLQCQQCNAKCKTCVNETNNCQICQNQIRVNPPTCSCIDGYYEDQQLTCQVCDSQCNTCELKPSNCLTCKPGRIEKDCKCMDGYFEIGQTLCSQCSFKCATCEFDPLNCKTCKGNRIKEPQCICQSGYYDDYLNQDCQKCDSTCLECNIKGCLSCFANRVLNKDMECIPPPNSVWYDNTPWCSTCQVAVVKAYLSDDISKIIIHFDFFLNPKGFSLQIQVNKCLQLFEVETVLKFGQNSICYINQENNQELIIVLGEYSKIEIGQEILFQSNSISHVNCETSLEKFIFAILQMPINPFPPQIEYQVPLHKLNPFAENSVYLKSIKNNGNRKLENIIWSCQVRASGDSSVLSQFIDQINFLQEDYLLIPKLTLPSDAELKFTILYENFIHINSYSEFTIYTHTGDLPQININVKPSYFVYETIIIEISTCNLEQFNLVDNPKYQIQLFEIDRSPKKSSSSQLNISVQSYSFEQITGNISYYTLSPNSTYTFSVIATNLQTYKVQNQNITIDIPFAGLICQFNNRGIQSIRQDLNLQIYCQDLDTTFDWNNDLDLSIQVDCRDLSLGSTCKNQKKKTINVNKTDTFQFITKNSISSYTVQEWTVTATKFQQTSKFAIIIIFLEDDFSFLDLEFNKGYLMRKVNNYEQLNFTFLIPFNQKADLLDLSIAIIYNFQIIQILHPYYISSQFKIFNSIKELNFGNDINLKFAAQFTNNIMPSLNNIKLSINQPPQCSNLHINRTSDFALTYINITTSCEQSNDSPYQYQLRLFLRESDLTDFQQGLSDISLIFYPYQTQNQFSIQTPTSVDSSKIAILIQVLDNGGSVTHIFEILDMKPAKLNCSSIQFQNLNLQNKISLLFEAINQQCNEMHQKIYLYLLQQQILSDYNQDILKLQAIKIYKMLVISSPQIKPQNRLLNEVAQKKCYDLNKSHLLITYQSNEPTLNLPQRILDLKENTHNLETVLQYFRNLKKQFEEELQINKYMWNEQLFQEYENSLYGIISLLFYFDEIYSNFSSINSKNEIIYLTFNQLLSFIPSITEEIQNIIKVNEKPLVLRGNEIILQQKKRTKSLFNQQFNIRPTKEDYLIDFIQYQSIQFKTNPLKFTQNLEHTLQNEFNDQTLQIFSENYYQIQMKNFYRNRFSSYENFSSQYSTGLGTYQVCNNSTQFLSEYQIQCVLWTNSNKSYQCNLNRIQNNNSIQLNCECDKFGDIFLVTSTNFSIMNVNNTNQQIFNLDFNSEDLDLIFGTSSLSLLFMAIYICQLKKAQNKQEEKFVTTLSNLNPPEILNKKNLLYKGNFNVFREKLKEIHQTISIFYYQDKNIHLSYRILEVLSQFNLQLTLVYFECYFLSINITFIYVFIFLNPQIILILRIVYKIIEAIYRFKTIAACISQFLIIILLMTPNLTIFIFSLMKYVMFYFRIKMQSELYIVAVIFLGNTIISQVIVEPLAIIGRILIYRLIANSLKNMDLNPVYLLMHFFVLHSSLEEIFEEFTKI